MNLVRHSFHLGLQIALEATLMGCGSNSSAPAQPRRDVERSNDASFQTDGADAPPNEGGLSALDCAASPTLTAFKPSNLASGIGSLVSAFDLTMTTTRCAYDTDLGVFDCGVLVAPDAGAGTTVVLDDTTEATMLSLRTFTLPADIELDIRGLKPLIIAVETDVVIRGTILAVRSVQNGWFGGGAPGPTVEEHAGIGPGGGGRGLADRSQKVGGGGGAFCGHGGRGSGDVPGGTSYGSPTLIPLVGGSSGGSAASQNPSNHGGGALEIVAGGTLTVEETGTIRMTGGGLANVGNGGGSGGAILLEARRLVLKGVLSANGGGGSEYLVGRDGSPSVTPAVGGGGAGAGSAGTMIDGFDSSNQLNLSDPAGGGGGAGRIRLNVGCGNLEVATGAVITPTLDTPCATTGGVRL